jgi:N-methylhydantoinase A/oxoprolinase/acetone carboxylase beta subunit
VIHPWTFAIDRGGTFTDVVARSSDGRLRVEKLLSEKPGQYDDAALEAIRRVLAEEGGSVEDVRMGTTVATNVRGRASHRLPGASGDLRSKHRPSNDALRTRCRDR